MSTVDSHDRTRANVSFTSQHGGLAFGREQITVTVKIGLPFDRRLSLTVI